MPEVPPVPRVPTVRRLPQVFGGLAAALGIAAAVYYATLGLTLSHYDAKAHLVVSRRILDSLTPGWEQIGAVWLPLPHLLNMLPVQIDFLYRTGLFAIALSIASHALAAGSIAAIVLALTSSRAGAMLAAALYALNPNVLYLQSTPMTEPMLFGLTTLQVYLFTRWVLAGRPEVHRRRWGDHRARVPDAIRSVADHRRMLCIFSLRLVAAWPVGSTPPAGVRRACVLPVTDCARVHRLQPHHSRRLVREWRVLCAG